MSRKLRLSIEKIINKLNCQTKVYNCTKTSMQIWSCAFTAISKSVVDNSTVLTMKIYILADKMQSEISLRIQQFIRLTCSLKLLHWTHWNVSNTIFNSCSFLNCSTKSISLRPNSFTGLSGSREAGSTADKPAINCSVNWLGGSSLCNKQNPLQRNR